MRYNHVEDQGETNQGIGVIILGMNPRPIKISIPQHDGRVFSLEEARLNAVTKTIELLHTKYRRNMRQRVCIWVKDKITQDILTYKCKRSDGPDLAKKQDDAWQKYVDMIKKDFRKINYQVHALEKENNLDCAWMAETQKLTKKAMAGERSIPSQNSNLKWNLGSLFQIANLMNN